MNIKHIIWFVTTGSLVVAHGTRFYGPWVNMAGKSPFQFDDFLSYKHPMNVWGLNIP
jgi:hypothetical protein